MSRRDSSDSESEDAMDQLLNVEKELGENMKQREIDEKRMKDEQDQEFFDDIIDDIELNHEQEVNQKKTLEISGNCVAFYISIIQFIEENNMKISKEHKKPDAEKLLQYYNRRIQKTKDPKMCAFEAAQKLLYKRTKIAINKKYLNQLH